MSDAPKSARRNPLLGLFGVVGNWPRWETYFDLSRAGLRHSFLLILACLPGLYLIARSVQHARANALDLEVGTLPLAPFFALSLIYLFSFAMCAYFITMLFDKQDRFRPWVIVRHWAVFLLVWVSAVMFALTDFLGLTITLPLGIGFAAYLGLLAIDVRLLSRIVGFSWQTATLLGCAIIGVGLAFLSLGLG